MGGPGGGIVPLGPPDAGERFAGIQKEILLPVPGGAVGYVYTVEGGTWQRVALMSAHIVTNGVAGNRTPRVSIRNQDGVLLWRWYSSTGNGPGSTLDLFASIGAGLVQSQTQSTHWLGLPPLWLPAGFQVVLDALGLDAGDTWSLGRVFVDEIDRGPYGEQVGAYHGEAG